ncbi:MAG: hypothetical protein WB579_02050 [Bryobacteraceae bacterium]
MTAAPLFGYSTGIAIPPNAVVVAFERHCFPAALVAVRLQLYFHGSGMLA